MPSTKTETRKKWVGELPEKCDVCEVLLTQQTTSGKLLRTRFIDGRTRIGSWAIMCPLCHAGVGVGLGMGRGQEYDAEGFKTKG